MSARWRLRRLILEVLDDPEVEFSDALSMGNCSAWDSVAMVQIVLAVEQEFDVRFTTDEVAEMRGVGYLLERLAAGEHAD